MQKSVAQPVVFPVHSTSHFNSLAYSEILLPSSVFIDFRCFIFLLKVWNNFMMLNPSLCHKGSFLCILQTNFWGLHWVFFPDTHFFLIFFFCRILIVQEHLTFRINIKYSSNIWFHSGWQVQKSFFPPMYSKTNTRVPKRHTRALP